MFGDRIFNSPFNLQMLRNETCVALCKSTLNAEQAEFVNQRVIENYAINWLIDGLPAARLKYDERTGTEFYSKGFELGNVDESSGVVHYNNHYDIVIEFHTVTADQYRVVGVIVQPTSQRSKLNEDGSGDCSDSSAVSLDPTKSNEIVYTYSIRWQYSSTAWATRWDKYLHVFDPRIHWFSLINSTVIVVFLSGMVGVILMRALHKDLARYNQVDMTEDVQEDSGWKLVHGDVFRPPRRMLLLSVMLGSGTQLFVMAGTTISTKIW